MTIHGGKFARIDDISTARLWSVMEQAAQPKAVASNTALGTARKRGVHSWSGSYQAYGATPAKMPGSVFNFEGYGSPVNDVSGAGLRYLGSAMVSQVVINWDWRTGAIIGHTVTFAGHLELTKQSGADPGDATDPDLPETTGTKIQWADSSLEVPVYADLPNVTNASLSIRAAVAAYVNSSTYVNGRAWTGQVSGPVDWSLAIGQQDEERLTGIFDIDSVIELKLFTTDALFWQLKHGIVKDFTGITANRETGAIMGRTINVDMNCFYDEALGAVTRPDTTNWWPFA
jgi:hypothetical protein